MSMSQDITPEEKRAWDKVMRGQVWCTVCGKSQKSNPIWAMSHGWPKCCGYTMTIDSPEERAALKAKE